MKISPRLAGISILPGLIALLLFYSLALHMRLSLGGWPTSIGTNGFSTPLILHSYLGQDFLFFAFLLFLLVSPACILVTLLVPRWRKYGFYYALCGFSLLVCIWLMLMAPEPFKYWWLD